jgi:hypothetical protein
MFGENYSAYGSAPSLPEKQKKERSKVKGRPTLLVLLACLVVPLVVFVATFWIRSFDIHYQSSSFSDILCAFLFLVPLVTCVLAYYTSKADEDAKPMALLAVLSLAAWFLGYSLGGGNFTHLMRPYYDINRLNVYPSVNPALYGGQQLMDAGQIQFTPGTHLWLQRSVGFKNDDTYCVAPIVSGQNTSQKTYDFWAVGINCCSAHTSDYHCGEYSNPAVAKGLRLMDDSKRDMFRLTVKKAQAQFNMTVSHPIFLHWLTDPDMEITAYQEDGVQQFVTWTFGLFAVLLCIVVCAVAVFAKM